MGVLAVAATEEVVEAAVFLVGVRSFMSSPSRGWMRSRPSS